MKLRTEQMTEIRFSQKLEIAKAILGSRVGVLKSETVSVELWNSTETRPIKRFLFVVSEQTSVRHLLREIERIYTNIMPWWTFAPFNYRIYVGVQKKCFHIFIPYYRERSPLLKVVDSVPSIRYTDI